MSLILRSAPQGGVSKDAWRRCSRRARRRAARRASGGRSRGRWRRQGGKLMVMGSRLGIGLFTALMGGWGNVWQFVGCRALMGVFAGFSSAAIALVASQVPEDRLGYSLGWLSTGQLVGSLVGPIIGGILADMTGSYRVPLYVTSAPIFLALGLGWFAVHEEISQPALGSGRRGT